MLKYEVVSKHLFLRKREINMKLGWTKKIEKKLKGNKEKAKNKPKDEAVAKSQTTEQRFAAVKPNGECYANIETAENGDVTITFEEIMDFDDCECAVVLMSEQTKKRVVCPAQRTGDGYRANIASLKEEMKGERELFRCYFAAIGEKKGTSFRLMMKPGNVYEDAYISTIQPDVGRYQSMVWLKQVGETPYAAVLHKLESSDRVSVLVDAEDRCKKLCEGQLKVVSERKNNDFSYRFSCVMAVYNAENYLREAIDSVINQTIGFADNIQLILVDDGSTDSSPQICDEYAAKYPENVLAIHKENGGVSSARNEGKKHAVGKYVNFVDSDDMFESDVFAKVWKFFEEHIDETDVVTVPLYFFDGATGDHWQNYKFEKGTRIINLRTEYTASCMVVNASFIKNKLALSYDFDERLPIAEDMKFMMEILINKFTLGVVHNCNYRYRRRRDGVLSLVKASAKKKVSYNGYLEYIVKYMMNLCEEKFGYVPQYVQNTLMMDLQWKLKLEKIPESVLTSEEETQYLAELLKCASAFDDEVIMQQRKITWEMKYFLLAHKYKEQLREEKAYRDIVYTVKGKEIRRVSQMRTTFDIFDIKDGKVYIEGNSVLYGIDEHAQAEVYISIGGVLTKCENVDRKVQKKSILGELARTIAFKTALPIAEEMLGKKIYVYTAIDNHAVISHNVKFGKLTPFQHRFEDEYYVKDNYVVMHDKYTFTIKRLESEEARVQYETQFVDNIKNEIEEKKAFRAGYVETDAYRDLVETLELRTEYFKRMSQKKKEIWLISDRVNMAGDNGEALFGYIQSLQLKDVECYFVLDEESADYKRLQKIGQVVAFRSREHMILTMLADKVISSHIDEFVRDIFRKTDKAVRDLCHYDFVFLQHGIIQNDLSDWLEKYNKNVALFVTSAQPEYDSILQGDYYYTEKEVKLTGLPRYDALVREQPSKKQIVCMPTWRQYIATKVDSLTGVRVHNKSFKETEYYQFYQALLQDEALLEAMRKHEYTGKFIIHPALRENGVDFIGNDVFEVVTENISYNKEFLENALLITDYSSVAFDFAYLKKPVIYTQFDKEYMYRNHFCDEGYWDYDTMGFGPVCYDKQSTVDAMIAALSQECVLEEQYADRIEKFYYRFDQKNCERVYQAIREL